MEWLHQRGNANWIGELEGITMMQIIAPINRLLRCEVLLMKRAKLTEAQLFVVDRYMKKREAREYKCIKSGKSAFSFSRSRKKIIQ